MPQIFDWDYLIRTVSEKFVPKIAQHGKQNNIITTLFKHLEFAVQHLLIRVYILGENSVGINIFDHQLPLARKSRQLSERPFISHIVHLSSARNQMSR